MNCFNNNKPKLTSSDRTRNINARTLYKSNVRAFQQQATRDRCRNYNGKVGFYTKAGHASRRSDGNSGDPVISVLKKPVGEPGDQNPGPS